MVFIDESGFLLQPLRRRVWAPSGYTPLQRAWDRRDRITTIAAVTRAPWALRLGLYYELLDHNARTADFIRFVREVHGHLRRRVILVWDRLPAHRSAARQLLADAASWLRVEWLPPYAPELNPGEQVWNHAKYGDLANFVARDTPDLHAHVDASLRNQRTQSRLLRSFFRTAKLRL